jgi:hypothetical protein
MATLPTSAARSQFVGGPRSRRGNRYCFVATTSGLDVAGSGCATEPGRGRGVLLSINSPGISVFAALVADGTDTPSVPGSWVQVSENVFVGSR